MQAHNVVDQQDVPIQLSIEPMPAGAWALFADGRPTMTGELRHVVLEAEQAMTQDPDLEVNADKLLPRGIQGHLLRDHFTPKGLAKGVVRATAKFRNADDLYLFLRTGGFQFWSPAFVRKEGRRQLRMYRSHQSLDSMLAWEVVLYRLENDGALPPHVEVPAGTCPRCFSQFVAVPLSGNGYQCLECHYESDH